MKKKLLHPFKLGMLLMLFLGVNSISKSATFTAVSSGIWSDPATWVGGVSPAIINTIDQITIPIGITVTIDNNTILNGAFTSIDIEGTLASTATTSFIVDLGNISGTGTISVNNLILNANSISLFTGNITVNTMTAAATINTASNIMIAQSLIVQSGTFSLLSGGFLDLYTNANIEISGGMLAAGSGTIGLSNSYNVNYTTMSSTSGFELNGTGLNNITIDVLNGNTVSLASNLVVNGTLSLTSGTLVLSDFNLTLNGNIASIGNGDISSNNNSNITINGTNSVAGALVFNGTSNAVNNFTINLGAMNTLNLGGTLLVQGTLSLNSGTLVFNTANLTIAGSFLGAGFLSGNSASNLSITTPGGLSTALNFAPLGQMLNNFRLAIQGSNSVLLGSNLTLSGDLSLEAGSALNLNGNVLTIDTTSKIIITGDGTIIVNPSSGLIINSHGLVSSAINFSGIIGMFTLNTNALDVITLGNNLNVSSMLNLTNGQLKLDNNDLTISGDISGGGAGIIHSTIGSNISVSSANTPAGALRFAPLAKSVNNLNISIGANGHIKLGSDLIIAGILNFISGGVNMGSNSINFGTAGSITGANANAYIITDGIGFLGMPLISGSAGGPTLFPIGTTSNYAPANIELNAASPSGILMATVTPMVFSNGTSGIDLSANQPLVNATWHFESDILANIDMNLGLMWSANMEVNGFNSNKSYLSQNESGVWDNSISGAASQTGGMYAMQRNHLMALNRFAIFDSSAITPVIEMSNLSGFQLYVNPSAENINIKKSNNSNELVYIDILNNLGQIV